VTAEGYEYFDVAADVGVRAWGADLAGCLRQCALGVFNLIVPVDRVRAVESREIAARARRSRPSW
jgi:SHS2 domain-containing protein